MSYRIVTLLGAMALAGCGVNLETVDTLEKSDPLYEQVHAECGEDALLLRALDEQVEAICCLQFSGIIPRLHCMTANGRAVTNPASKSKLRAVANESGEKP